MEKPRPNIEILMDRYYEIYHENGQSDFKAIDIFCKETGMDENTFCQMYERFYNNDY